MPTDVLTLPQGSMNTKWKEPYGSASFNQKFVGIIAPGIYRGLLLAEDPLTGDRTVLVQADPDKIDHVAVYENFDGFSITYRDAASGDITLSLTAYSSVTVVVCILISYTIGADTTGVFRVYTSSEFSALPTSTSDHLVILGTVVVPASGPIVSGSISLLHRTLASENISRGTILNAPLIKNSGFELGEVNGTYQRSSTFWDKTITVGTGQWKTSTALFDTGLKSVELTVSTFPMTGELSQQIGMEATADQLFLLNVRLKQLKTISSGALNLFLEWSDANDALLTTTTLSLDGGIDSAFRTVHSVVVAPAGAVSLRTVGIRATTLSPSGAGVFAYLDNVDVLVEPRDTSHPYPFDQTFRRRLVSPELVLSDRTTAFSAQRATIRLDSTTPASEGQVVAEATNPSNLPPALNWLGRLFKLGAGLLATEANALKPRVDADISVTGGVEFTLMWQSARAGETTGTYTQAVLRTYASATGSLFFTANAIFDGSLWAKDISGAEAFRLEIKGTQVAILYQVTGTNSWSEASWLTASTQSSSAFNLFLGQVGSQFAFTTTTLIHDADIVPATTDTNSIGSATVQPHKVWTRALAAGPNPTDDIRRLVSLKSAFNWSAQTDQVDFEYVSKYFGTWSRKGHRFSQDWDGGLAAPPGWTTSSTGAGTGTNTLGGSQHRTTVAHDGSGVGTFTLQTISSVKFRLTDGFVCRIKMRFSDFFTKSRYGFIDVGGTGNGITFGCNVVDGGGSHDVQFFVGAGETPVGGPGDHAFTDGSSCRWYSFAVVGTTLWWLVDATEPDDLESTPSDSFPTSGSATITVPTGLFHFAVKAQGIGSGFGSTAVIDYVEIITGNRDV